MSVVTDVTLDVHHVLKRRLIRGNDVGVDGEDVEGHHPAEDGADLHDV